MNSTNYSENVMANDGNVMCATLPFHLMSKIMQCFYGYYYYGCFLLPNPADIITRGEMVCDVQRALVIIIL